MTNLEYYKDEIVKMIRKGHTLGCCVCHVMNKIDENSPCEGYKCTEEKFCDWLLEEHKEPIKLMSWEKDLLDTLVYGDNNYRQSRLYNVVCLEGMKRRYGHFKGVTDISMTLGEILDNCEVVDD